MNNRDGLADALKSRLEILQVAPKPWHPEILALLLELSDQPTSKSKLSHLYELSPPEPQHISDSSLRWETIAKEDGWDEDDEDVNLWKTNRYDDSSDDALTLNDSAQESSDWSSDDESEHRQGGTGRTVEDVIVKPDDVTLFNAIRSAQEWRKTRQGVDLAAAKSRKTAVSEVMAIREVLFMLQGLDTTMFDSKCVPVAKFQTSHLIWETHKAIINAFSEFGRQLRVLRLFTKDRQNAMHLQAFQSCISTRLHDLDTRLSAIHARLASPMEDTVVSLVKLKSEITGWIQPLSILADIILQVAQDTQAGAFRYLELLYEQTNLAQLSGREAVFEYLGRIFVECFRVYLRPVRLWMDEGKLMPNDEIFFVCEAAGDIPLGDTWRRKFELRMREDSTLHAPSFLHPAANRIMNAGKNIVVLARLGKRGLVEARRAAKEPPLDFETICPTNHRLAPFADLFEATFDRWIESKYYATSAILKDALLHDCGLSGALDALQHLYLFSDGAAASKFCEDLFGRIDSANPRWHERYALTALAHEAFGDVVDSDQLYVRARSKAKEVTLAEARDSVATALPHIQVTYRLSWPLQMVLSPGSSDYYQGVFTLLLQFRRATYVLCRSKILDHYWTDQDDWRRRSLYYSCRNSLLWFCNTMQTYLSTLVLTPSILHLKEALSAAPDVDTITAVHDSFIKQVVDEACLGSRLTPIRECMLSILDLAIKLERPPQADEVHLDVLKGIKADFERHLRFICVGLRGVARASGDSQAAKWDTLGEMLQTGEAALR